MRPLLFSLGGILALAHFALAEDPSAVTWQGRPLRVWLQEVRSGQPQAASEALYDFCRTSPVAIPALIAALDDKNKDVRQGAAGVIHYCGSRNVLAVPKLLQAFQSDPSRRVRRQVAETLCALFPCGSQIAPNDEDLCNPSAGLLLAWKLGVILPVLLRAAEEDKDAEVRAIMVFGLRTMRPVPSIAVPVLLRARKDMVSGVRCQVAFALSEIAEAKTAVPAVVEMLRGEDEIHTWALTMPTTTHDSISLALAQAGPAAVPYLLKAFTDPSPRVRAGIALALGRIEHKNLPRTVVQEVLSLLQDKDVFVRVKAALSLRHSTFTRAIENRDLPSFAGALRDSEKLVRIYVVMALGEIALEESAAFPVLQQALQDPACEVRSEAIDQMGRQRTASDRVVPLLLRALCDPEPGVRWAAVRGLGNLGLGAKDAVPALYLCAWLGDEELRRRAEHALSKIRLQMEAR